MPVSLRQRRLRHATLMFALAALAISMVGLVSCRAGDEGEHPTATATTLPATATVTATVTATATATASAASDAWPPPLGVPAVDAAVSAFRAGDLIALLGLIRAPSAACTTAVGAGGPPKCPAGVADGTVIDFAPYFECDGWGTTDAARARLIDDSTYTLAVIGYDPPVATRVSDEALITHAVVLARAGFGAAEAAGDARLLTTIAFDDTSIRQITGDCGAYSQSAFAEGELPALAEGAQVLWRRYPGQAAR